MSSERGLVRTIAMAALVLPLCVSACDDRETAMARCQTEAIKTTPVRELVLIYTKDCMTLAGWRYDESQCTAKNQFSASCYVSR